jgi:hypothetical protein
MADYPEWVMKFKKKGTYINFSKGKYYLYAAHSERVPGTKKVNRVCDAYLGRITEEDGLIPPKDKVTGDVEVFEYGLSATILSVCENIYTGLKRTYKRNADLVMAVAIISVIHGFYDINLLKHSYLSIMLPHLDLDKALTEKQNSCIERGIMMINDKLNTLWGDEKDIIMMHLKHIYKVKINNRYYTSQETTHVKEIKQKYNIEWSDLNG